MIVAVRFVSLARVVDSGRRGRGSPCLARVRVVRPVQPSRRCLASACANHNARRAVARRAMRSLVIVTDEEKRIKAPMPLLRVRARVESVCGDLLREAPCTRRT